MSPQSIRFTEIPLAVFSEDLRSFPVCYCRCYHPDRPSSQLSRKSFLNLLCFHHLLCFLSPNSQRTWHKASRHLSVWDFKHVYLQIIRELGKRPQRKLPDGLQNVALRSLSATSEASLLLPQLMLSAAAHRASKSNMAAGDV